ncbi:hypothetical protein SAMN04515647_1815 [Cohaesibacter sp. ES.047]|nr:hypothetical protein SAMN04515647_1815 [Cohaesibacter sp. ES.047]
MPCGEMASTALQKGLQPLSPNSSAVCCKSVKNIVASLRRDDGSPLKWSEIRLLASC